MFELIDEIGGEHVDILERLQSAQRDKALGDVLDGWIGLTNLEGGKRITCWVAPRWHHGVPDRLRIKRVYTTRMADGSLVELRLRNAPTHALVLEPASLARLKNLSLVEVHEYKGITHGNLPDHRGGHHQSGVVKVAITERGKDFLERKWLARLAKSFLPLKMRKRLLVVSWAVLTGGAYLDAAWWTMVVAVVVCAIGWYSIDWWSWVNNLTLAEKHGIATGRKWTSRSDFAEGAELRVYMDRSNLQAINGGSLDEALAQLPAIPHDDH